MDHACPSFIQAMGLAIFQSGKFDTHTAEMRLIYRERMETMIKSLTKRMPPGVTWTVPHGGFSLMVELPRGYSSVALLLTAIDRGVSFLPGPLFDIDQRFVHALRLSCAWTDKNQIKEGVELLASAIEDCISRPPGDSGLSGLGNFQ
jgi:DNA-binding transcriptional MocR family regulator